jgi:hypothetical protein
MRDAGPPRQRGPGGRKPPTQRPLVPERAPRDVIAGLAEAVAVACTPAPLAGAVVRIEDCDRSSGRAVLVLEDGQKFALTVVMLE